MKKNIAVLAAALVGIGAGRVWTLANKNEEMTRYLFDIRSPGANPDANQAVQFQTEALPRLMQALSQQDTFFETAYSWLCSELPETVRGYLPEIVPSAMIRLNAAAVVGRWGKAALPAVPQLIRLLKDDLADGNAALSLGMIGPEAKEAIPALIEALEEQRPFAATALAKLGVAASVAGPTLQTVAEAGSECVRREALLALHQLAR